MLKLRVKDKTVWFSEINYEFLVVARCVCRVYSRYNTIPVVTRAAEDAPGSVPNSWHFKGLAWDFRIWGVDDPKTVENEMATCANEIRKELNAIDYRYTVLYGDAGHKNHMHIEYDLDKVR